MVNKVQQNGTMLTLHGNVSIVPFFCLPNHFEDGTDIGRRCVVLSNPAIKELFKLKTNTSHSVSLTAIC